MLLPRIEVMAMHVKEVVTKLMQVMGKVRLMMEQPVLTVYLKRQKVENPECRERHWSLLKKRGRSTMQHTCHLDHGVHTVGEVGQLQEGISAVATSTNIQ